MEARLIGIEFGEGQRIRRVVSRSNHRVTGKYPSLKRNKMAYWESPLERDAFRRLDADSTVLIYEEQPAKLTYSVDGKAKTHYPDILVTWKSSRGFLEVKTDQDADSTETRERTNIMIDLLRQAGLSYRIWRESEIRVQPALDNEIRLLAFSRRPVPIVDRERIRRLFSETPAIPWEILTRMEPNGIQHASRLVIEGMLLIDRDTPLTATSLIRLDEAARSLP